jgi:hypothetical protein
MLNVQSISAPFYKGSGVKAMSLFLLSRQFHTKMKTSDRIGPHNSDVISVLVGCLLGDAYANQSKGKTIGTSFRFKQSGRHKDYLFFLYDFFAPPFSPPILLGAWQSSAHFY